MLRAEEVTVRFDGAAALDCASLEVGQPIANKDFLMRVFPSLGDNRREALKIAAGFRSEEAFEAGVGEEQALDVVHHGVRELRRRRDGSRFPSAAPRRAPAACWRC